MNPDARPDSPAPPEEEREDLLPYEPPQVQSLKLTDEAAEALT